MATRIVWTGSFPVQPTDPERFWWGYATKAFWLMIHTKNGQPLYASNDQPVSQDDLNSLKWIEETADPEK